MFLTIPMSSKHRALDSWINRNFSLKLFSASKAAGDEVVFMYSIRADSDRPTIHRGLDILSRLTPAQLSVVISLFFCSVLVKNTTDRNSHAGIPTGNSVSKSIA
jgi:hypothetical protein